MLQLNAKRLPRSSPPDSNDPAAQVSGEVDLEPVPRERVMLQHDAAVTSGADIDVAAEAQDPARLTGEHAHLVLIRMKVEVADRPGHHRPNIHDAVSPAGACVR